MIRNFTKTDVPSVLKLAKEMVDYHHSLDPYYKPARELKDLEKYVAGWLKEKDTRILVFESGGETAAYARIGVEIAPVYARPEKIGVVYDLVVSRSFRRQKIGERLFKEALEWFRNKKVKNVELNVDARSVAGVKFWEKLGFLKYKLRMRLDI